MINNVSMLDLYNRCCGCAACENICPVQAITMTHSDKGFYIPNINLEKCIKCQKCISVCNLFSNIAEKSNPSQIIGAYLSNFDEQKHSSSGGIFGVICKTLYEIYGNRFYCYGAIFQRMIVKHYGTNDANEFVNFYGSKYVQSDLTGIYKDIELKLKNNNIVLFSGTGCQCAALRAFVKKRNIDTTNLYIIDLICHGAPSPKMWNDYILALETHNNVKITDYRFRNKNISWHGIHPIIQTETNEPITDDELCQSWGALFGKLSLNEICHNCPYASCERTGDLTLGDFWGVDKQTYGIDRKLGVSECLINTKKGEYLVTIILNKIETFQVNDDSYLQPQLSSPTPRNIRHKAFWRDYRSKGYIYVSHKYTKKSVLKTIYSKMRKILK